MRRVSDWTLAALSVLVALAAAFGTFGTALWTNIHVDGHPEDSVLETMAAVAPLALLFLGPPVILVIVARVGRLPKVQRVFPIAAIPLLAVFTFGYGLLPVIALIATWGVPLSLVRRRWSVPPLDVIVVSSYWLMFAFFAYAESHR